MFINVLTNTQLFDIISVSVNADEIIFKEVAIMLRYRARARYDRRHFRRTASRTRAINIYPMFRRGGIRL